MKVVLYILTAVFGIGSVFLGYTNTGRIKEVIAEYEEKVESNRRLANNIDEKKEEIESTKFELDGVKDEIADAQAQVEAETRKAKQLQKQIAKSESRIEEAEESLEGVQMLIDEAMKSVPGDLTLEELPDVIAQIESDKKNKELQLEDLQLASGKLDERVQKKREEVTRLEKQIAETKERIKLNSATGRVTSVNIDWGFCVVSLGGTNSNIDQFSEIIVSRGGRFIAKLEPKSIEPTQTICNINLRELKPGVMVQSGDQVVLAKTKAK